MVNKLVMKSKIIVFILMGGLFCNFPAFAGGDLVIHLQSYHLVENPNQYHQENYGVGWKTPSYSLGYYRNSENKDSFYAGGYKSLAPEGVSITYGVVSGYSKGAILPYAAAHYETTHLMFSLIPGVNAAGEIIPVIGLSLKFANTRD